MADLNNETILYKDASRRTLGSLLQRYHDNDVFLKNMIERLHSFDSTLVIDNTLTSNLYVDGTNGNDANDGLTAGTALKTIQSAVDKVSGKVFLVPQVVNVAAGTYVEDVTLNNVLTKVRFQGVRGSGVPTVPSTVPKSLTNVTGGVEIINSNIQMYDFTIRGYKFIEYSHTSPPENISLAVLENSLFEGYGLDIEPTLLTGPNAFALYVKKSTASMNHCVIAGNRAGLYRTDVSSYVNLRNSKLSNLINNYSIAVVSSIVKMDKATYDNLDFNPLRPAWYNLQAGGQIFIEPFDVNKALTQETTPFSSSDPLMDGTAFPGITGKISDAGHRHPSNVYSEISNWTTQTSAANNSWNSVAYGNGLFVAVSSSGTGNRVMTSPDGINWTLQTSAADNNWYGVTYGNGLFVAVAQSGTGDHVMTSPDGINWTIRTPPADNQWNSVVYGNGLFVSVANTGIGNRVMTSPDGINWTIRTSAADNDWRSVVYGNGLFVAVAQSGTGDRVMTSPDGINWTLRTSAADNGWYSVAYAKGMFVAVGSSGSGNRVMTAESKVFMK